MQNVPSLFFTPTLNPWQIVVYGLLEPISTIIQSNKHV